MSSKIKRKTYSRDLAPHRSSLFFAVRFIAMLIFTGVFCAGCSNFVWVSHPYKSLMSSVYITALNSVGDGYGYDSYIRKEKKHYPMVFALLASAESNRYIFTHNREALQKALQSADWLCENKDVNKDNIIGWGLPFAWDPFGDGSENPAHTEYTITTDLVIQGLLDTVDAISGSDIITRFTYRKRIKKYLKVAQEAVDSFIENRFYTDNNDGTVVFWYSSQPADCYPVTNVNAMTIGILQRISTYCVDVAKKRVYQYLADSGVKSFLTGKIERGNGWYWNYLNKPLPPHIKKSHENYGTHAAYVADGLLMYKKYGGHLSVEIDKKKILNGLKLFIKNDRFLEMFSRPELSPRTWSMGYFLYVISNYYPRERIMKDFIYGHILIRQKENGFRYTEDEKSPIVFVRHNAHILLGLSKYYWKREK